jgi:hypothetical protein
MKLTSAQIEQTTTQFEAMPIPPDNSMVPELSGLFGDHTFFLDGDGLHIVEPGEPDAPVGRIVKLASWTDRDRTILATHPPQPTDVVVDLDKAA